MTFIPTSNGHRIDTNEIIAVSHECYGDQNITSVRLRSDPDRVVQLVSSITHKGRTYDGCPVSPALPGIEMLVARPGENGELVFDRPVPVIGFFSSFNDEERAMLADCDTRGAFEVAARGAHSVWVYSEPQLSYENADEWQKAANGRYRVEQLAEAN